jgi:hypothetical protein
VKAEVDEGYWELASEFPGQVSAPPRKPENLGEGTITEQYGWRQAKRRQSSQRIAVEHANAELRQWRPFAALDRTPPGLRRDTLRDRRPGL